MKRRRFLSIAAAATGAALLPPGRAAALTRWRGTALGAAASIHVAHPEAQRLIAMARAEIDRLEDIFSLYRPASELARLNAEGILRAPSFELLECLSLAGRVHRTTGGVFDPTIQPLWALYAEHAAGGGGGVPSPEARAAALRCVGWGGVRIDPQVVSLPDGAALTLNGIAQGYVADRVADLLRAAGLGNVLIDTGEIHALGRDPEGNAWRVGLASDANTPSAHVVLVDAAVASSAPLGTVFDRNGTIGHILDPRTGMPVASHWRSVSVVARRAAQADALSTAFCGMEASAIETTLAAWPEARLSHTVPA